MSHRMTCLVAESRRDQLVIAPHRAVEEYHRRALDALLQLLGHAGAGRQEIEIGAAGLVANAKPERIAEAIIAGWMRLSLQIPRTLAGHMERQHLKTGRRAIG